MIAVSPDRIAFEAATSPVAQEALQQLVGRYGNCPLDLAQVVVALGGDGAMLETIHRVLDRKIPVYGMNRGSVGFLMNAGAPSKARTPLPASWTREPAATP